MKKYDLEDFSPCKVCLTRECGLIDGNECEKCNSFLTLKSEFESMQTELFVTRRFIYEHNLVFELLSFIENNR